MPSALRADRIGCEHAAADIPAAGGRAVRRRRARRLGRDPVPQRGGEHRALRRPRRWSALREPASAARSSSPTTRPRTARPSSPPRPARASCTSRAAATAAPTSPASPPRAGRYIVMGDADLTYDFAEIPRFVEKLDDGAELVMGDRMDNIHPGRDAVAAPLRRQPGAHRRAQPLLPHGRERRALRHARAAPRRAAAPRPAHDRDGVRLGDGDPGLEGEARHPRVPDRVPPARRREQAVELPRRLAPPALPARPQPDAPVHAPGRAAARARRARRARRRCCRSTCSAASGSCTRWSPARCS